MVRNTGWSRVGDRKAVRVICHEVSSLIARSNTWTRNSEPGKKMSGNTHISHSSPNFRDKGMLSGYGNASETFALEDELCFKAETLS